MDSLRPGLVVTLMAQHFTLRQRLGRALWRGFSVMFIGLLIANFLLLLIPTPHLHVCSIPISILLGPIVAIFVFRTRVQLAAAEIPCPRCAAKVMVPDKLGGWPARFNCQHCAIMIELQAAL
ncbi:MAG: hypothetical protein JNM17_13745 [Archangium sp.]|nr:hypothetical protein [Archangium sp.]